MKARAPWTRVSLRTCAECGVVYRPHQNRRATYCSRACAGRSQSRKARENDAARFWSKVKKTDDCWLWHGTIGTGGYGYFVIARKRHLAHRLSYSWSIGPVPEGLQIDHLCRVRNCINPAHLEPVTVQENLRRGVGWSGTNAQKTHCKNGHEFTPENTYLTAAGRHCRTCRRIAGRKADAKRAPARRMNRLQPHREASDG